MIVKDVLDAARILLTDPDDVRHQNKLMWFNDALLTIALVRSDASQTSGNIPLSAGCRQSIPQGGLKLLRLSQNMGGDGNTPGRVIPGPSAREVLDSFNPLWMNETGGNDVKFYFVDDHEPRIFWTNNLNAGRVVHGTWSIAPATVVDENVAFPFDTTYVPPAIEWVMHRCLSVDLDSAVNPGIAGQHAQTFFTMLGVKYRADLVSSPRKRDYQKEENQPIQT